MGNKELIINKYFVKSDGFVIKIKSFYETIYRRPTKDEEKILKLSGEFFDVKGFTKADYVVIDLDEGDCLKNLVIK